LSLIDVARLADVAIWRQFLGSDYANDTQVRNSNWHTMTDHRMNFEGSGHRPSR